MGSNPSPLACSLLWAAEYFPYTKQKATLHKIAYASVCSVENTHTMMYSQHTIGVRCRHPGSKETGTRKYSVRVQALARVPSGKAFVHGRATSREG